MKRRHFIKGIGSALIYLPICDFMLNSNGTAFAQSGGALPTRVVLMQNGVSLVSNFSDKTGPRPALYKTHVPNRFGANYDVKAPLAPMNRYAGLQDYVSVVSNLKIPHGNKAHTFGGMRGGTQGEFHADANRAQLLGGLGKGVTSGDRLLQQELDPKQALIHMNYNVQAGNYNASDDNSRGWSQWNKGEGIPALRSPKAMFAQLFSGGVPSNSNDIAKQKLALSRQKSILDLLDRSDIRKVAGKSRQAGLVIEEYLEQIRTLEKSLSGQIDRVDASEIKKCAAPKEPAKMTVKRADAYNNEKERALIINEMIAMSMACNISRFGTLRITDGQCYLKMKPIVSGAPVDDNYHKSTHHRNTSLLIGMYAWHMEVFTDLANRLKNQTEGSGNILDNSAIVLMSEGGGGTDIDTGYKLQPHAVEHMMTLVAGKAGRLKGGIHIDGKQNHPTKVIISAMKAAGSKQDQLGYIKGILPDLFG